MSHEDQLKRHGIPPPAGAVLELRYVSARDDWYARTAAGWFWYDGHAWKPAPMGPL